MARLILAWEIFVGDPTFLEDPWLERLESRDFKEATEFDLEEELELWLDLDLDLDRDRDLDLDLDLDRDSLVIVTGWWMVMDTLSDLDLD